MDTSATSDREAESDYTDSQTDEDYAKSPESESALLEMGEALLNQSESEDDTLSPTSRIDSLKKRLLTMKKELSSTNAKLKKANE